MLVSILLCLAIGYCLGAAGLFASLISDEDTSLIDLPIFLLVALAWLPTLILGAYLKWRDN